MSKRFSSNGPRETVHVSGHASHVLVAPAMQDSASAGSSARGGSPANYCAGTEASTHFEIPPSPLNPATVAAPPAGRSTVNRRSVLSAAAPLKRKAVRSRRDRVSGTRANFPKVRGNAAAKHEQRGAAPAGDGRSAAAQVAEETAAQADRTALAHELDCSAVASANGCSIVVCEPAVAASDDAHEKIAAGTKSMDEGRAIRKARADAALSRQKEEKPMPRAQSPESEQKALAVSESLKIPTDPEALLDGPAYVRAVAMHVDLVGASARLVVSTDEKVSKAELDRLRELIFGKGGPAQVDEPLRIDWTGIPRPDRERRNIDEE